MTRHSLPSVGRVVKRLSFDTRCSSWRIKAPEVLKEGLVIKLQNQVLTLGTPGIYTLLFFMFYLVFYNTERDRAELSLRMISETPNSRGVVRVSTVVVFS